MAEQFTTLGATTLNGAINSAVTSIVVTSAASLPSSGTFRLRLNDAATFTSNVEIVKVTAVSGTTLTVVRGQEGTSAVGHSSGDSVTEVITAAALTQFQTDTLALANMLLAMPADVAVTTTATISSSGYGKMHVCSGTSANYAVTLPDATVAPAGTLIGFRMATLSKLVTLTSSSGNQMDSAGVRVMWNGESAILESDGAAWRKIAGKTLPMYCQMRLSSQQTGIVSAVETTLLIDGIDADNTGLMADTTNHRIKILRNSSYTIRGLVMANGATTNMARWIGSVFRDPNTGTYAIFQQHETTQVSGSYAPALPGAVGIDLVANDKLQLSVLHTAGANQGSYGAASGTASNIAIAEIPTW